MDPVMYIFLNAGLRMSTGKAAAQAAHAAVEAFRRTLRQQPHIYNRRTSFEGGQPNFDLIESWYSGGHYKKLVMEARDSNHLRDIQAYIGARGFKTALIIDEGATEIPSHTPTALGVELVDKDDPHTAAAFSLFKLYKDSKPTIVTLDPEAKQESLEKLRELHGDALNTSQRPTRGWWKINAWSKG